MRLTAHGLNGQKVEEIDYACSRHNIHLICCPVRHMGTEYSLRHCGTCISAGCVSRAGFTFLERTCAQHIVTETAG